MQAKKHLTAELIKQAAEANIKIRAIDPSKPVAEQGPFDLILQKCRDAGTAHHYACKFYGDLILCIVATNPFGEATAGCTLDSFSVLMDTHRL